MIAHKPHSGAPVQSAGDQAQHQPQVHPSQMAHLHHPSNHHNQHQHSHIQNSNGNTTNVNNHNQQVSEHGNYYGANEQYTLNHHQQQEQIYNPETGPSRFAPAAGRPQLLQQQHQFPPHHSVDHHQQQQQAQPQVPPPPHQHQHQHHNHQLPYKPPGYEQSQVNSAATTSFPGVEATEMQAHRPHNAPVGRSQAQQRVMVPQPYGAGQQSQTMQQTVSVRPSVAGGGTTGMRPMQPAAYKPPLNQQHNNHQHLPQQANLPHQMQQSNYPNANVNGAYPVTNQNHHQQHHHPHHQQQQQLQQTLPPSQGILMGDPSVEQYQSNSPTLLQQQLSKQRLGIPGASQQISRHQVNNAPMTSAVTRPQRPPGGAPPTSSRYVGDQVIGSHPELAQAEVPYEAGIIHHGHHQARQASDQSAGIYYQQQQPQQQQPPPRSGNLQQKAPLRQPMQQQLSTLPIDNNHLLGNPTPPLTPNATNVPSHLLGPVPQARPIVGNNIVEQDEWQPLAGPQHGPPLNGHMHHQMQIGANNFNAISAPPPPQLSAHKLSHVQSMNNHQQLNTQQHQQQQQNVSHLGVPGANQVALQTRSPNMMPKSSNISAHYNQQPAPLASHPRQQMPANIQAANQNNQIHLTSHQHNHQQSGSCVPISSDRSSQVARLNQHQATYQANTSISTATSPVAGSQPQAIRLTLPLNKVPLLGPFRLDHEAQFTSKNFNIKPAQFETLRKSLSLNNPLTAAVTQEIQFSAHLVGKTPNTTTGADNRLLVAANNSHSMVKSCNWPELFQFSVNHQMVYLDRTKDPHEAVDILHLCQAGDNILEIQVDDCYCTHEFLLEAVERPTLKAFMNSCFKSRLLSVGASIQKLKSHFNLQEFLVQNSSLQAAGIFNEYLTDYNQATGEQVTKARVSMRCPISARRMRTPTRGHSCKHLQCFDLENFLFDNRDRSQWNCPICLLPIPFNMLELDQHQITIISQASSEAPNADDLLMDCNGQWQPYRSGHPISNATHHQTGPPQSHPPPPTTITTAKSNGTFHPQPPAYMAANASGGGSPAAAAPHVHGISSPQLQSGQPHQQVTPVRSTNHGPSLMAHRQVASQQQHRQSGSNGPNWLPDSSQQAHNEHNPSPSGGGSARRPPSVLSQHPSVTAAAAPGRRSTNSSPLAKRPYSGQYASPHQASPGQVLQQQQQQQVAPTPGYLSENTDDLSPLAAMERTIIQHEQQMGPPPYDASTLTTSSAAAAAASPSQRNSHQSGASNNHLIAQSPATGQVHSPPAPTNQQQLIQSSPDTRVQTNTSQSFSPMSHGVSSPARLIAASPQQQQQQQQQPPQSPMHQQQSSNSISTPATPSMLVHGGPETPATPSNSSSMQQHGGPSSVSAVSMTQSPHVVGSTNNSSGSFQANTNVGVDHQPLSNGSASAGSITSTSTMTPGSQSLGSVGMGGDSRCNTAPLQVGNNAASLGLDDLMLPGGTLAPTGAGTGSHHFRQASSQQNQQQHGNVPHNHHSGGGSRDGPGSGQQHLDEKNEILMSKLMMDSNESILKDHRNSELAMALEEAEWKQQLDRGKSEHLANFLNEPLMNKKHRPIQHHQEDMGYNSNNNNNNHHHQAEDGANKMLSGGLNPSDDDEADQSPSGSSPGNNNIDNQLDQFVNYMDSGTADDGAGLPPDDSILDLFER